MDRTNWSQNLCFAKPPTCGGRGVRTALIGAISSAREDTVNKLKNITKLASLHLIEHEIIQIDNVLERIYELFPTDPQVRIFSARVSDALFELEQALHGMNVVDFTGKTRGQEAAS